MRLRRVLIKMTEEKAEYDARLAQKYFEEECSRFEKEEPRGGVYDQSQHLISSGLPAEGALLFNAIWNNAKFRYHASNFDMNKFERAVSGISTLSKCEFLGIYFGTVNFDPPKGPGRTFEDMLKENILRTYDSFAEIKGVEYTGATKVMHLFCPNLFIPWDQYIRDRYVGEKKSSAYDYLTFLQKMKEKFGHLSPCNGRTLPKCIDEFNYVTISIPAVAKLKKDEERRKIARKNIRKDPRYKELKKKYFGHKIYKR